jgi:hypothetical protein
MLDQSCCGMSDLPLEPVYPDPFEPFDPERRRPMPKRPFKRSRESSLEETVK